MLQAARTTLSALFPSSPTTSRSPESAPASPSAIATTGEAEGRPMATPASPLRDPTFSSGASSYAHASSTESAHTPSTPLLPAPAMRDVPNDASGCAPAVQEQPAPPTSNGGGAEKTKLLKKARKLSRIFGDSPLSPLTPVSPPLEAAFPLSRDADGRGLSGGGHRLLPPSSSASSSPSGSSFALDRPSPPSMQHRHKKLTRKPSARSAGPPPPLPIGPPRVNPTVFSRPALLTPVRSSLEGVVPPTTPVPSLPLQGDPTAAPSAPPSPNQDSHPSMIISAPDDTVRDLKDDASIISTGTVSSSKSSSEQLQRARLAKLSRHLGEAIPEELVLKPVVAAVPSTSSKPAEASRRQVTASRPRRPRPARRMSLDLTSLIKSSTASTAAAIPTPAINATRWGLTRSKSLFTGKAETRRTLPARQPLSTVFNQQSSSDVKLEAPAAASIETTSHEPLSERDRALNVKRARKMAQLFGSDPPPALFQITNLHGVRDDALLTPLSKRGSLATFVSTEEGLLTPVQGTNGNKRASWHSQTSAERKRASLITFVSSASAEDALLLAPLDAKRSSSLHSADSKRASVITFISTLDEVPERTAASPRDLAAGHANSFFSLTIDTQAASAHVPSFDDPPASAPFANTIPLAGAAAAAAAAEKSSLSRANTLGSLSGRSSRSLRRSAESSSSSAAPAPTEAWALRRRAAKLSQFFGVEYNDLDPARVRPASPPPPVPPIPARPLEIPAPPDSPPLVDVEVQHVGRRWGVIPSASRDRVQDMNDVRNRLRQMRAAS